MAVLCRACAQPFIKDWWYGVVPTPSGYDTTQDEVDTREDCPLALLLGNKHNVKFLRKSRLRQGDQSVYLEYGIDQPDAIQLMLRVPHDYVKDHSLLGRTPSLTIDHDPLSDIVIRRVKEWLEVCDNSHNCRVSYHGFPSRILDVGSSNNETTRLALNKSIDSRARYVALSHCWGTGNGHRFVLTTENEVQLLTAIPYDDLPTTFQDAISLCRRLGIRYLWIDSLCIVQNDPQDWAREAVRMHSTYRYAYLTLIAARAVSDTEGFLQLREPSTDQQPVAIIDMYDMSGNPVRVAAHILRSDRLWPRLPYESGIGFVADREPVSNRAWIMQERNLSRRKILYCHDQIFWECQEQTHSEDGYEFPTVAFQVEQLYTFHTGYSKWYSLVSEYSFCHLTYEKDVFPALAGLTNYVARLRKGVAQPCAGIWTDDIARGLAWKLKCHRTTHFLDKCSIICRATVHTFRKKTENYQAPTFSWGAWRSGIAYDYASPAGTGLHDPQPESLVQYVDHSLRQGYQSSALLGPYEDGWLQLRAFMFRVTDIKSTTVTKARMSVYEPSTDYEVGDCHEFVCEKDDTKFTVFGTYDSPGRNAVIRNNVYILPLLRHRTKRGYLTFLIVEKKQIDIQIKTLARVGVGCSVVEVIPASPPPSPNTLAWYRTWKRPFSESGASERGMRAFKRARKESNVPTSLASIYSLPREAGPSGSAAPSALDTMFGAEQVDVRLI